MSGRADFHGTISGWNADSEARLVKAMGWIADWTADVAGGKFDGVITAKVTGENGEGITLVLKEKGGKAERTGELASAENVRFSLVCTAEGTDDHELGHDTFHAIDDVALDYKLDDDVEFHDHGHHHHEHEEECHCHDHEHEHEHHHEHGDGCCCHDHDHEHHHHDHDHEETSLDLADGVAVGLQGSIKNWDPKAEDKMAEALMTVGKWVTKESGCLLGHIKAAVVDKDGKGVTLNLTDIENGVERHGELGPMKEVRFAFMCAVVDVDEHELRHRMFHAVDDTGLKYELDEHVECHCHDHEHHHHDHEDGCCCHDHDHEHEHHDHADGGDATRKGKGSFLDKLRRKTE